MTGITFPITLILVELPNKRRLQNASFPGSAY
jgi:hypothetical protein